MPEVKDTNKIKRIEKQVCRAIEQFGNNRLRLYWELQKISTENNVEIEVAIKPNSEECAILGKIDSTKRWTGGYGITINITEKVGHK